ncbi:hypothetical protein F2P56_007468 [Juglans regia]|uniref:Retrotransposon gag domain-containing protein n=1 Tax=Juglans regia TaxID=51240 RepID=A0A833Y3M3_JUGRE|nr:hypothetical protein F2P56_007468 [Juglans regia]
MTAVNNKPFIELLVKCRGMDEVNSTWEPIEQLRIHYPDLVGKRLLVKSVVDREVAMDGCAKDKQKLCPRTLVGVEIIGQLRDHWAVQETHEKQQAHLQQIVEGLAQVEVMASNLELLLKYEGKKVNAETNVVVTHSLNPLFEDTSGIQTKTIHLEFPTFDGADPNGWLYRANQFFKYHQPHPKHRVLLASIHMEGKALTWFQEQEAAGAFTNWEVFERALLTRFGPSVYEDAMEALTKLRQTTTVEAYKSDFEHLSNQLHGLAESYKLSYFLDGLRKDIRYMVCMMRPTSLLTAFGIVKMQEENMVALKRIVRIPMGSPKPQWALPEPTTKMSVPI